MKRAFVGILGSVVLALVVASTASAVTLCASRDGQVVMSSSGSTCAKGGKVIDLAASSDVSALTARVAALESKVTDLQTLLAGVTRSGNTLSFTGMNLQLKNGLGSTHTTNGLGNLIIGYNENRNSEPQTGSHNLVLGTLQKFTAYGGIVAGEDNAITGPFASVTAGNGNTASAAYSSVSGGISNTASYVFSSISGGSTNTASGQASSVSGGRANTASGDQASILGGLGITLATDDGTYPVGP